MSNLSQYLFLMILIFAILGIGGCLLYQNSFSLSQHQPAKPPVPYILTGVQEHKKDRVLSLDVNMSQNHDYEKAFQLAQEVGIETVPLSLNWRDIEIKPGTFQDPDGNLKIANVYYPAKNTKVALYIRSVDTNSKPVPHDLLNRSFAEQELAERYLKMIEWTLAQIPQVNIEFLSLADEMDLFWGNQKTEYEQWKIFYKKVIHGIKLKRPDLKVGFTITLNNLVGPLQDVFEDMNRDSDMILVSYYPHHDFLVKDPQAIHEDYDQLIKVYPQRIIYIEQTGYPTSALMGSTESKQREFVRETFLAWDKHQDQIKYISFVWLHDLPQESINFYKKYYQTSDKHLLEFLKTLGFRRYEGDGEDKEGFLAIKAEAKARGWGQGSMSEGNFLLKD